MTRNIVLGLPLVLIVAACGTPQEQCIDRNTSEYRTVSRLLADVEGNLARGYAWEEREVTRQEWDDCPTAVRDKKGNSTVVNRPCLRNTVDTERYRVPIDPDAETRKADYLAARKARLARSAATAVDACKAAYPEDKK